MNTLDMLLFLQNTVYNHSAPHYNSIRQPICRIDGSQGVWMSIVPCLQAYDELHRLLILQVVCLPHQLSFPYDPAETRWPKFNNELVVPAATNLIIFQPHCNFFEIEEIGACYPFLIDEVKP